ncbi:MAG TPA: ribokinase [Candidatus Limnocylindrales bacterium]|nr:ribokinase [Candidatus Limnocylindrales bacterium]
MEGRSTGRVIVVGSVNEDLVVTGARLPGPGETVAGGTFGQHHGGKGANQAVAAARLGAVTLFVGAVGDDALGTVARDALEADGVDVSALAIVPGVPTGVALILVGPDGENAISVAGGANGRLTADAVRQALAAIGPTRDDVVLVSNEIPAAAVLAALSTARGAHARVLLNPAPADGIGRRALELTDVLTPNRTELAALARLDREAAGRAALELADPQAASRSLLAASPDGGGVATAVVVTLGGAGALLVEAAAAGAAAAGGAAAVDVPAPTVRVVDTTGAGDAFSGCLAASLALGVGLRDAVGRAVVAGALATTRPGARAGMPTRTELEAALA